MEKVYIVYEEDNYGVTDITCVFATLNRAKAFLKSRAKGWIKEVDNLKKTYEDIDKVSNLNLTTDGDFYVDLQESAGVTYYLRLDRVIGAKNPIDKKKKSTEV